MDNLFSDKNEGEKIGETYPRNAREPNYPEEPHQGAKFPSTPPSGRKRAKEKSIPPRDALE